MQTNSIRAFISIAPDKQSTTALAAAQHSLRATGIQHVRWTRPDQIHLTLCFLGNICSQQLPAAIRALEYACLPFHSFELQLANFGAFPNLQHPRVLWIGLTGALDTLCDLQASVHRMLTTFGNLRENKRFHPHLTLGRVRQMGKALTPDALPQYQPCSGNQWQVRSVLFMQSELHPGGAQHSLLAEQHLTAKGRDELHSKPSQHRTQPGDQPHPSSFPTQ